MASACSGAASTRSSTRPKLRPQSPPDDSNPDYRKGDRTMTDVRDAPATANENQPHATGGFIWYELMTPDPEGAKAFYDAVVGWTFSDAEPAYGGYRMIGRSDGKFAGGVLPLNDEMQE